MVRFDPPTAGSLPQGILHDSSLSYFRQLYLWPDRYVSNAVLDPKEKPDAEQSLLPSPGNVDLGLPTVEQVIAKGFFSVPKSDPATALISDRSHVARFGLDDLIGQLRRRREIYDQNNYEIEQSKCTIITRLHRHEQQRWPDNERIVQEFYKTLDGLYEQQRDERVQFWKDVSRLRESLVESVDGYLSAHRTRSILEERLGDGP